MRNVVVLFAVMILVVGCIGPFSLPMMTLPVTVDADHGEQIFTQGINGSPPCSTCHFVAAGQTGFSLGPSLAGIGERAVTRVEGVSAEDYLHESIVDPHVYVVSGYRAIMYPGYADHFDEQDVQDLIAYLLTL